MCTKVQKSQKPNSYELEEMSCFMQSNFVYLVSE